MKKFWLFGLVFLLCVANAMAISHNATSVTLTTGTYDSGNVTSTWVKGDYPADNSTYNWSGVGGVPGFDIRFNVSGVTADRNSYVIAVYAIGSGGDHQIHLEVFNFTGSTWDTIVVVTEFDPWAWGNISVYSQDYLSSGTMWVRYYHADSGNAAEDFSIDYFQVVESDAVALPGIEYEPVVCPINSVQSTLLYMFIGVLIVGFAVWASYTTILFFSIVVGAIGIMYAFPLWGCNPVYGLVIVLGFLFYMLYEAFFRKFKEG